MIGILRKIPLEGSVELVRASRNAGLTVVEVTLDSPSALEQISRLATEVPGVSVGAGSVTGPRQVRKAHEAGAEFIVSPVVSVPVARACRALDLPHFPGAATPTEIQSALEAGAVAVKVFPAEQLGGASFIRALMSPLGAPHLMPRRDSGECQGLPRSRRLLSWGGLEHVSPRARRRGGRPFGQPG